MRSGYAAELPGVIWDVQRVGPSTGLPTRTSQADLTFTYFLGHGDVRHVVLLPGNMEECFECGWRALDLAEQLQTPVFVLSDLDLGMNQWMSKPFEYPSEPMKRGKVYDAAALEQMKSFARYLDTDGDGVGYRTLPGTDHPLAAYFTRGTGHNEYAIYSERPDDYVKNAQRLARKHETARTLVPKPAIVDAPNADTAVILYGSLAAPVQEALDILRDKHDLNLGTMRVRALPFSPEVFEFVSRYKKLYVIENNTDGQLAQLLRIEIPERAADLVSIAYLDGLPFTAAFVVDRILEQGAL
jgi:2-oxoglutarate ferredoxin oxidoreductase subunit alpha